MLEHFTSSSPTTLFIDMNSFFASVEQQENPKLRGRPVAVAPLLSDSTCAISASYEARSYGIKTGTMIGEAKRLCPDLVVVSAKHGRYVVYHHQIVEALHHFFVDIRPLSIDEMACTLSPRQRARRDWIGLGTAIKERIYQTVGECLRSSIGIGPNVFLAKVATELQKPNGLVVLEDNYAEQLFRLELRDLPGIAKKMASRLAMHNIYTVEELWNAPRHVLHAVWGGINGDRWYFMLRGCKATDYGMHEKELRRSVSQSHVLPPEFRTITGATDILMRLTSKALKRLRSYNQAAKHLSVWITFRHADRYQQRFYWQECIEQDFYANDDLYWLNQLEQVCANIFHPPRYKPIKASICFSDLVLWTHSQIGMFEDRKRFTQLFEVIDSINQQYGHKVDIARVYHLKKEAPFRIAFGNTELNTISF